MARAEADWLREQLERIAGGAPIEIDFTDAAAVDALIGLVAPDGEYHEADHFPGAGVYRGQEAMRAYVAEFTGPFERVVARIDDVVPGDAGRAVALLTTRVRGRGSGAEAELRAAWVFTIADERVVRVDPFVDVGEALAAAGARRA
jgi:ketosteroid isomerase-like protein